MLGIRMEHFLKNRFAKCLKVFQSLSRFITQKVSRGQLVVMVVVLISAFLFHYIVFSDKPGRRSATLTNGLFTFHLDASLHEALFPRLQRHTCREVISADGLCRGRPGAPLLLLAVKSHPASSGRRAALRRTWARPGKVGGFRLQPVFLMGATSNIAHARLVHLESRAFGDVVMWDFVELRRNLSLKQRCFLQWAHEHCRRAAYVFKGEDDLFVNLEALAEYLSLVPHAPQFIHGNIQFHATVVRDGERGVPHALYPLQRYPNFASGGGLIVPGSSIAALYQASLWLPVFPLDDVYLGFLALAAGLPHRHNGRFRVWRPGEDELPVYRASLSVHGVSAERIEEVWKKLAPPWGEGPGGLRAPPTAKGLLA